MINLPALFCGLFIGLQIVTVYPLTIKFFGYPNKLAMIIYLIPSLFLIVLTFIILIG